MQDIFDIFIVDLMEDIVQYNGDYRKIHINRFKNALGEISAVSEFYNTVPPTDISDSPTSEEMKTIEEKLKLIRQEISNGVLAKLSDEVVAVLESKYSDYHFGMPIKEYLAKLYVQKICSEHAKKINQFRDNLIKEIIKNGGDYLKISMDHFNTNEFKLAIGSTPKINAFNKTGIPFDFADPITPEKIQSIEDMIEPLRQEISSRFASIISKIPRDVISNLEKKYNKLNFEMLLKEHLTNTYLLKICSEHVELMWSDKLTTAKRDLIYSVILGEVNFQNRSMNNSGQSQDLPSSNKLKNSEQALDSPRKLWFKNSSNSSSSPKLPRLKSASQLLDSPRSSRLNNSNSSSSSSSLNSSSSSQESPKSSRSNNMNQEPLKSTKKFKNSRENMRMNSSSKLLDSPRSPRKKITPPKNQTIDHLYGYMELKDFSKLTTFSFFNEIKDNNQFMSNRSENTKKLLENKKWRDDLAPPFSVNSVTTTLNIINTIRQEFISNDNYLDLIDTKIENLSDSNKISALYNLIGSYVAKTISLALLGHPRASHIMSLFLLVYPEYDTAYPERLHAEITGKIGHQHSDYFYSMISSSSKSEDSDDDGSESDNESINDKISPSMLFHAINEIVKSEHFLYTEEFILQKLQLKGYSFQKNIYDACVEIQSSSLSDEFSPAGKNFFNKLLRTLDKNFAYHSPRQTHASPRNLASSSSASSSTSPRSDSHSLSSEHIQMASSLFVTSQSKRDESNQLTNTKSSITLPDLPALDEDREDEFSNADSEIESPKGTSKKVTVNH